MSDLISVIVPVFKAEPYLDQCIQSIVDQTYRDLEILLIDDGSPDQCPQICDKWAEKYPRIVVVHKENGGVSRARNTGIERATGKYIAFVDSDDFLEPTYAEYLYRALCDTGADISECRYTRCSAPLETASARAEMPQPVLLTAEEALWIWSHPKNQDLNLVVWNKIYRRELIGEIRFAAGYNGGEDVLFTCLAFIKCRKIARIDNELYHWRDTPQSASKRFPDNALQSVALLLLALDSLVPKYPAVATACKILLCRMMDGFFYTLQYEAVMESKREAKEKMLSFRRQIRFTLKEWMHCSTRDKIMILCSHAAAVGYYIRFRRFLDIIG